MSYRETEQELTQLFECRRVPCDRPGDEEVYFDHLGEVRRTGLAVLLKMGGTRFNPVKVWWPLEKIISLDAKTLTVPRWLVDRKREEGELPESIKEA